MTNEETRSEIAKLLTHRCNNCYSLLPGEVGCSVHSAGWNWVTPNFGPFCDDCIKELNKALVTRAPQEDSRIRRGEYCDNCATATWCQHLKQCLSETEPPGTFGEAERPKWLVDLTKYEAGFDDIDNKHLGEMFAKVVDVDNALQREARAGDNKTNE